MLPQRMYGCCFIRRCVPNFLIDTGCAFALIFRHSFDGQHFTAIRVGQQVLQGLDLAPSAFLVGVGTRRTLLPSRSRVSSCLPPHRTCPYESIRRSSTSYRDYSLMHCCMTVFAESSQVADVIISLPSAPPSSLLEMVNVNVISRSASHAAALI
jgi:hypothetical protein